MSTFFLPLLFFMAAMLFSIPAQAKFSADQMRPLTEEEKTTFYPMVCNGPPQGQCDELPDDIDEHPTTGGPVSLAFVSIAYGSYSKAGADEAFIMFQSNLGGEVRRGLGAVLFERDKGHWNLAGFVVDSMMSSCVLVPSRGQQRMLCLDDPFVCCEANQESLDLITVKNTDEQSLDWNVVQDVLEARDGLRAY